ncbi:MAG: hypothetical protein GF329_06725 [Candidatus Lokiarchaeota archaeon]|nr:hypothetical protein [Candidatus Lokiarchaeota archaeon]
MEYSKAIHITELVQLSRTYKSIEELENFTSINIYYPDLEKNIYRKSLLNHLNRLYIALKEKSLIQNDCIEILERDQFLVQNYQQRKYFKIIDSGGIKE